jgi:hypothetical protein
MPPTRTPTKASARLVIRRQHPEVAAPVLQPSTSRSAMRPTCCRCSRSYLLKDRVAHVSTSWTLRRGHGRHRSIPVVAQLLVRHHDDPLERLTPRELDVLRLMARPLEQQGSSRPGQLTRSRVRDEHPHSSTTAGRHRLPGLAVLKFLRT